MAINLYNIKKWAKMLGGNSLLHVNQGIGQVYSKKEIEGYYNDLTEKVLKDPEINRLKVPIYEIEKGKNVYFPIMIFQYGLGAYDLFLLTGNDFFLKKFYICVEWAINNQKTNGSWDAFSFKYPQAPYSSMAQGEGVSLLLRAYKNSGDKLYLHRATEALDFMLEDYTTGGTTKYSGEKVYFLEYTSEPVVLNGWIFSIFGLYDYLLVNGEQNYQKIYDSTIKTLLHSLEDYDNGYWSRYNNSDMIASPFYHKLHIAQLEVMYNLTENEKFLSVAKRWNDYQGKSINKYRAFSSKAIQKILE